MPSGFAHCKSSMFKQYLGERAHAVGGFFPDYCHRECAGVGWVGVDVIDGRAAPDV